jgi:hypothetical protein
MSPRFTFGPSTADRLLANCWACKIELLRSCDDDDDGELAIAYEIKGEIPGGDADGLLAGLIAALRQPRAEGGECNV